MTRSRTLALIAGAFLAVLLLLIVTVPILFRDRIEERLKAGINKAVEAKVEWEGIGLTLFRSFPDLTVRMDEVSVTGIGPFDGDTLASIGRFRVVLGLGSVLRAVTGGDRIAVRSVALDRPAIHLRVLEDGTANWDIMRETPEEPEDDPRALEVSLRRVSVRDATITLENREAGLDASLRGFDQSLAGDFRRERFTLRTRARADEVSLRFAGVPYLTGVRLDVRADVDADRTARRYTFGDNEVRLNDLPLRFSGSAAATDEGLALDLAVGAPRTDFRHILSLVPAIYTRDFGSLETSGTMAVSGRVRGTYGDETFPALSLSATVEKGTFRYPDRPLAARDISLDLVVENPGGDIDSTVVALKRIHLVLGNDPIDGALTVRTPVSDPDIDLRLAGKLNLADLERTMKLERIESLAGTLAADVAMRTRMSFIDAGQYERVTARGRIDAAALTVRMTERPHAVVVDAARLELSPRAAELTSFRGRIGSSDLQATGRFDNLLGYAIRDQPLRGRATVQSSRLDLNEWQADEHDWEVIPVPPKVDLAVQAAIEHLSYGRLEMRNARGAVRVMDRRLTLDEFRASALDGEIAVTGFYETTDVTRPTFDAMVRLTDLNIPSAFTALGTIRLLAPVARYARGTFSTDLGIRGALGPDMMPLFEILTGRGSLETSRLVLPGFPVMNRVAEVLRIPQLESPTLDPVRALFEIRDGRLHLRPFDVRIAGFQATVAGSNGLDQSLDYTLRLEAPRALLGAGATQVLTGVLERAGRAGLDLEAAEMIELGLELTGTVTRPSVQIDAGVLAGSVEAAVRAAAARRVEEVEQRVDEAAEAARREARAEADRLIREAEQRAAAVREQAERLAFRVRQEGHDQADSLVARASGPIALAAARLAADRLREESDERADQIIREAARRAEEIVAEARRKANALREPDP